MSFPSPCFLLVFLVFLVFRGIFDAMDIDGSNDIDINEFQSALGKMSSKKRPKASKEDMQGERWRGGERETKTSCTQLYIRPTAVWCCLVPCVMCQYTNQCDAHSTSPSSLVLSFLPPSSLVPSTMNHFKTRKPPSMKSTSTVAVKSTLKNS